MDDTADVNEGLVKRKNVTGRSKIVDLMGKLHCDMFFQDRYLLNRVDMKIKLVRSKNSFALMAGGGDPTFKIIIREAAVFVRKIHLSPTVKQHISKL
jgi:hypothetical protein